MPYKLQYFKDHGVYNPKPTSVEVNLEGGKVIPSEKIGNKIKFMLEHPGGTSFQGDRSKQDFAVIKAMLKAKFNPADVMATFSYSPRGRDAMERKEGHYEDYLTRTIEKAKGYIDESLVKVDFSVPEEPVGDPGINVRKASEVDVDKIRWIWPSYIPQGKLTILAGDPGQGKSQISLDIAARISRSDRMPC